MFREDLNECINHIRPCQWSREEDHTAFRIIGYGLVPGGGMLGLMSLLLLLEFLGIIPWNQLQCTIGPNYAILKLYPPLFSIPYIAATK